ncbi:hypothetical protein BYT27DRAFT_7225534 [Phlegmacium glaucopus]|nr:hypothetical protein BYT27DRAFT_7225534 [Phlegmacium glaucopus]
MNKEIESQNAERALKTLNHTLNNEAYPGPGSDAASLITLDPEDRDHFKIPPPALSFRDYIYSSLAKWIADEDSKRRTGDEPRPTAEEARIAKRHCMDGKKLAPWVVGVPWQAKFPQSLFDTEGCVAVPLPFFLNENLQILNAEAATLPTIKTNPNPGETKGISIIDVDKLSTRFGKELSLTCSQWTEAAGNMYLFQKERDAVDTGDLHSDWYNDHFNFYLSQRFKVRLYDTWKADDGRPPSLTTDCLICAERGHGSRTHNDSPNPVKFKDGKPTWSKHTNRNLVTPDNRVICINWNTRGSNATCAHGKDERMHVCSFCGQKGHYAFSWTCRSPPN